MGPWGELRAMTPRKVPRQCLCDRSQHGLPRPEDGHNRSSGYPLPCSLWVRYCPMHVRSHSRSLHSNPVRWVLSRIPSLQMRKWRQRRVWLKQPVSGRGSVQSRCPGSGSSALQVGSARGSTAGVDAALAVGGVEPSCKSQASEPPGGPAGSPHGLRTEAGKTRVTVQWRSQQDMEALGLLCLPLAVCL